MPKRTETTSEEANVTAVKNDDKTQNSNGSDESRNITCSEPQNYCNLSQSFFVGNSNIGDKTKRANVKCKTKRQHVTHEIRTALLDSLGKFRVAIVSVVSQTVIIFICLPNVIDCFIYNF